MNKHIGILGSGIVGITLANGFKNLGFDVGVGNRKASGVKGWNGSLGTYSEVAANSDTLVLAVKGSAAESVIKSIREHLTNKTIIDTTNPISDKGPDDGVLGYFTTLDESLMERLQNIAPKAKFVKAFNSVGNAYMVNPDFKGIRPVMFICGNNSDAKSEVTEILSKLGWGAEDFGGVKSARVIEPLCILWCIPGFLRNQWSHSFTLLKA